MEDHLQTKVGKRPGLGVYVQASAIEGWRTNLKDWEVDAYFRAYHILRASLHFQYDFVHIVAQSLLVGGGVSGVKVRFMKMSSLFDAHPYVVESNIVDLDKKEITVGKPNGQIYHRLDTIVDPQHPSYLFHQRVTKWEESAGLFSSGCPVASIGNSTRWEAWVDKKVGLEVYKTRLSEIFKATVPQEFISGNPKPGKVTLGISRTTGLGENEDEIHVDLTDSQTRKIGIRAAFTFADFARALMGEFNIQGRIVRWNMPTNEGKKP